MLWLRNHWPLIDDKVLERLRSLDQEAALAIMEDVARKPDGYFRDISTFIAGRVCRVLRTVRLEDRIAELGVDEAAGRDLTEIDEDQALYIMEDVEQKPDGFFSSVKHKSAFVTRAAGEVKRGQRRAPGARERLAAAPWNGGPDRFRERQPPQAAPVLTNWMPPPGGAPPAAAGALPGWSVLEHDALTMQADAAAARMQSAAGSPPVSTSGIFNNGIPLPGPAVFPGLPVGLPPPAFTAPPMLVAHPPSMNFMTAPFPTVPQAPVLALSSPEVFQGLQQQRFGHSSAAAPMPAAPSPPPQWVQHREVLLLDVTSDYADLFESLRRPLLAVPGVLDFNLDRSSGVSLFRASIEGSANGLEEAHERIERKLPRGQVTFAGYEGQRVCEESKSCVLQVKGLPQALGNGGACAAFQAVGEVLKWERVGSTAAKCFMANPAAAWCAKRMLHGLTISKRNISVTYESSGQTQQDVQRWREARKLQLNLWDDEVVDQRLAEEAEEARYELEKRLLLHPGGGKAPSGGKQPPSADKDASSADAAGRPAPPWSAPPSSVAAAVRAGAPLPLVPMQEAVLSSSERPAPPWSAPPDPAMPHERSHLCQAEDAQPLAMPPFPVSALPAERPVAPRPAAPWSEASGHAPFAMNAALSAAQSWPAGVQPPQGPARPLPPWSQPYYTPAPPPQHLEAYPSQAPGAPTSVLGPFETCFMSEKPQSEKRNASHLVCESRPVKRLTPPLHMPKVEPQDN